MSDDQVDYSDDDQAFIRQSHFGSTCRSSRSSRERNLAVLSAARAFLDGQTSNPDTLRRLVYRAVWAAEENEKLRKRLTECHARLNELREDKP